MNFTDLSDALTAAADTPTPTTKRAAAKLADTLRTQLDELTDWLAEVTDLVDGVAQAADELTEAGSDDRDGAHDSWIEMVGQLHSELRAVLPATSGV